MPSLPGSSWDLRIVHGQQAWIMDTRDAPLFALVLNAGPGLWATFILTRELPPLHVAHYGPAFPTVAQAQHYLASKLIELLENYTPHGVKKVRQLADF